MRVEQPVTVIALIAAIVWVGSRVIWPRLREFVRYRGLTAVRHWDDDGHQTAVVSASCHDRAISAAADDRSDTTCAAYLVPERDEYDESAVVVVIKGRLVGQLSQRDATHFRRRLAAAGIPDAVTSCQARIDRHGEVGKPVERSITLSLATEADKQGPDRPSVDS